MKMPQITKFEIGKLYWHKFPYDHDENEAVFDLTRKKWARLKLNKKGANDNILLYLGEMKREHVQNIPDIFFPVDFETERDDWGLFFYDNRQFLVYLNDLCEVDLGLLEERFTNVSNA